MSYTPPGSTGGGGTGVGPPGPQGAPGQGYTNRGTWSSGSSYAAYDVVSRLGSSYTALTARTTGSPAPEADSSNWQLLAAKGDQGIQGVQGNTGPAGPTGPQGPAGPAGGSGSLSTVVPTVAPVQGNASNGYYYSLPLPYGPAADSVWQINLDSTKPALALILQDGPTTQSIEMFITLTQDATGGVDVWLPRSVDWSQVSQTSTARFPLVDLDPLAATYLHLRWVPLLGWIAEDFRTGIEPLNVAWPTSSGGSPTYLTGGVTRGPHRDKLLTLIAQKALLVPASIRQSLQGFGLEVYAAEELWDTSTPAYGTHSFDNSVAYATPPASNTSGDVQINYGGRSLLSTTNWQGTEADGQGHIVAHEIGHAVDYCWPAIHFGIGSIPSGYNNPSGGPDSRITYHPTMVTLYNNIKAVTGSNSLSSGGLYSARSITEWFAEMMAFYWMSNTTDLLRNCANNTSYRDQFVSFIQGIGL